MSLQVWLPLNGNTNNYGVCNFAPTVVTAPTYVNGKLGKAMSTGAITIPAAAVNTFYNNKAMSFCFWIYALESTSTSAIIGQTAMAAGDNRMYTIFQYSSPNHLHLSWQGEAQNNATFLGGQWSNVFPTNTWTHCAITYNGSTAKIYINGTYTASTTGTSPRTNFNYNVPIPNSSIRYLNDLRIYDEVLTEKQIKEISKALVCHYPLDNNGIGMPNYFVNSNFATGATTNWYGVNGSSIRIETKDGYKCITGTKGTSANICCQIPDTYNYVANSEITFTISADVYVEETGTFGVGNWISTTEASGWQGMSGSQTWHTSSTLKVGWNHISVTRVNGKNQYNGKIVTAFSYSGTTYWMTNVKFEFGDVETPWCPNSTDASYSIFNINGTTEFDTSGYKHNATIVSTIPAIDSDSPRYSCAYKYSGSINNAHVCNTTDCNFTDDFSWAGWFKPNYTGSTAQYAFTVGRADAGGYGYGMSIGNSACGMRFGNKAYSISVTNNTWVHLAFTKKGTAIKAYKNGSVYGTYTFDGTLPTYSDGAGIGIGCFHYASGNIYPYYGSISDFRLYATVLSDADILELYNTGASIDNGGNILAGDIVETSGLVKPTIEKNTIIQNNEFDESEAMNLVLDNSVGQKAYFTYSYIPVKDTNNSCLRPCYVDFSVIPNLSTSTTLRAIIQVTWSGFDTSSTAGTFAMYWSGDNFKISTNAWAWEGTNPIMAAISAKYDIKNLVLSATSGSYLYDVTFNLTQSYINTYSKARIGVRTDYSNGTAKFSMDKIILIEDKYSSTSSTKAHMGKDFMAGASFIEK